MKILYLHGWQSVPGGVKPTFLAQHGHLAINPKLPDDDFAEAIKIAQDEFDHHQPDVIVGSSRGGAVGMNIISGDAKLVLLCPAWKKFGSAKKVKPGTVILHIMDLKELEAIANREMMKHELYSDRGTNGSIKQF